MNINKTNIFYWHWHPLFNLQIRKFKVPKNLDDDNIGNDIIEPHSKGDEDKKGWNGIGMGEQDVEDFETRWGKPLAWICWTYAVYKITFYNQIMSFVCLGLPLDSSSEFPLLNIMLVSRKESLSFLVSTSRKIFAASRDLLLPLRSRGCLVKPVLKRGQLSKYWLWNIFKKHTWLQQV